MHAVGERGAEFEHLGTEGGDHFGVVVVALGSEHRRGVHRSQVLAHLLKRRRVLVTAQSLHEWLVAHAQAQYESVVVGGIQCSRRVRGAHGVAGPDVGDTRGDGNSRCRREQQARARERLAAPGFGQPHRGVAE